MLNFAVSAKGIFAAQNGKAGEVMANASANSIKQAMTEWATGSGTTGTRLSDRLAPSAFQMYGFTKRTQRYQKAQRKAMGTVLPYYSPRRLDLSRLVTAAARGNAVALIAAASNLIKQEHMANQIVRPGGFTISTRVTRGASRVAIRYPGARALNQGGAKNAVYRKELADWSMGGGRDSRAILARAQQIFDREFSAGFAKVGNRKVA